jgi:tRNA(Ile)-lysidine synthase
MDVELPKVGRYVVAVSGGVDSVALLNMLSKQRGYKLSVAHFDHGIREEPIQDRLYVQALAKQYGLPFVYDEGHLGPQASEATARQARYDFLRRVQALSQAEAIITAHHQDDVLETAIINMIRGTGRKGLTSLHSRSDTLRPLLQVPKSYLVAYAQDQGLAWREDSTNLDTSYLRNHVRHNIIPQFSDEARTDLINIIMSLEYTNRELDEALAAELQVKAHGGPIDRAWFTHLPHETAREVMASWLRSQGLADFGSKTLERLVVAAKVATPGRRFPVLKGYEMTVGRTKLALEASER